MNSPLRPEDGNWLRLNEVKNAIDYLEKVNFFIHNATNNIVAWKWIIISLHGALYSFAIIACKGTDSRSVIVKDDRLINIWEALKRCRDSHYMKKFAGADKHLIYTNDQEESVNMLVKEYRNEFIHFKPAGWSIHVDHLSSIVKDVLDVISFLALDAGGRVLLDAGDKDKVKKLIEESIGTLNNLNN